MNNHLKKFSFVSLSVFLFASVAHSASALEVETSVAIGWAAVEQAVPAIASETLAASQLDSVETADGVRIELENDPEQVLGLSHSPAVTVGFASEAIKPSGGVIELDTDERDLTSFLQSTSFGFRILNVLGSSSAPEQLSYSFDVPPGVEMVETPTGFFLVSGTTFYGRILPPWAIDSAGKDIPTSYSWSDGVLTQNVDLSDPTIQFPVFADPAWGYVYTYPVNKTSVRTKSLLKSCFNCYFPVSGAPKNFPIPKQILPLKVAGANFECKFVREITSTDYFAFQFDATKNHVDGLGSNIIFQFMKISGAKYLVVDAYIENDSIWVNNDAYRIGAAFNWYTFAQEINNAI